MPTRPYAKDVVPPVRLDSAFGWVTEDRMMTPEEEDRLKNDINLLRQVRAYMMSTYAHGRVPGYGAKFNHLSNLEREAMQILAQA